jgi:Sugar (and other) transporter
MTQDAEYIGGAIRAANFAACSTGRSTGFVPLKTLSTTYAARLTDFAERSKFLHRACKLGRARLHLIEQAHVFNGYHRLVGKRGIFTIDLPLVQEFIPAYKRGWVSALITTLLPGGSMLAEVAAWQLLPIVGWRGLFLVGLVPLVLVFMIRYWVPESPRWLMLNGRHEESATVARLGADDRSQRDRLAEYAGRSHKHALDRAVQISAVGCRRVSHRPYPDWRRFAWAVGTNSAGARAGPQVALEQAAFLMIFRDRG